MPSTTSVWPALTASTRSPCLCSWRWTSLRWSRKRRASRPAGLAPSAPVESSPGMGDLRYIDAGVDIDAGNRAVQLIKDAVASTHTANVLSGIGRFAGAFALPAGYKEPVLVSSTDSVGTKVKVAIA